VSTKSRSEFTLTPLIHVAASDERSARALAPHRYWLRPNGEVTRDPPFISSGSTPFIVRLGALDEPLALSFDTMLPVSGTPWRVRLTGSVGLTCPPAEVHRLVRRWSEVDRSHRKPDMVLAEDVVRLLNEAVAGCSESTSLACERIRGAGAVGVGLASRLKSLWGLQTELQFAFEGRERFVHTDLRVEARVHLKDLEPDITITAVVQLLPTPTSLLRALATLDMDNEIKASLDEELKAFYPDVTVDELLDPRLREVWKPRLMARIEKRAEVFGRKARLVQLTESQPPIRGEVDEFVRVTLTDFALPEGEHVDLTLLATLRLTSRSKLLRAMASKGNLSFNAEFEQIARHVFGHAAAGWSAADLKHDDRHLRQAELRVALEGYAPPYGYELVHCTLTTSRDPQGVGSEARIDWEGPVRCIEPDVVLHVEVTAQLKYRLGAPGRRPSHDFSESIKSATADIVTRCLAAQKPSIIYGHWSVPMDNGVTVQDDIKAQLVRMLKTYADDPVVTVKLRHQVEHVQTYDRLRRSTLECKGVRLNPDNVPGEVMVDLHAPIRGIHERAWGDMARLSEIGETWDPVASVTADIQRLMQSAFAAVLSGHRKERVSKRQIIDLLRARVADEILRRFLIDVEPEIRFYSAPEVVDFYKRTAGERKTAVQHYFELREQIAKAIHAKREERVRLITEGLGNYPAMAEVDDAIDRLIKENSTCEAQTQSLQREFADAISYVHLLSAPSDLRNDDVKEGILLEDGQSRDQGATADRQAEKETT
jgi:hypothetical protein